MRWWCPSFRSASCIARRTQETRCARIWACRDRPAATRNLQPRTRPPNSTDGAATIRTTKIKTTTGANAMRRPPVAPPGAALLGAALAWITMLGGGVGATPAVADTVADFYRGKQIRVIVRTTPGTDYDQYSRLIARYMGKHIPGNPSMVVVNMTGGGGIIAANYMAQVAPRDGTVIGIVSQGLAADQALGMSPQLKANLREFGWLANV